MLRLMYDGRQLHPPRKLSDYNIAMGETLDLLLEQIG
jgi:hypothetical protein